MEWEEIEKLKTRSSDDLIDLLKHSDEHIRRLSALELGNRKELRAVDELIMLLQDNETVFSAAQDAAWALAEIGNTKAVEPLIAMLNQPFVSGRAIEALAKLHDEKALDPLICLFEQTHVPSLATVLGNWGNARAVEPLIRAMNHSHPHVRFYAARALGKLGDKRAIPVLKWARDNDTTIIGDTKSLRGKSVSHVAGKAINQIGTEK